MKNLRNFWALPAFLRLSLAFSVQDDLLAFPQYEVRFLDSYVPESIASSRLALAASQPTSSATPPSSKETQELSKARGAHASADDDYDADELYDPDAPAMYEEILLGEERYLCRIPVVDKPVQNGTSSSPGAGDEEEKELLRATDRGWELLQGMKGDCIYYLSGWWSYSFCYNKEVKQFHQLPAGRGVPSYPPVEDTHVHSYVLGKFPGKAKDGKESKDGKAEVVDDDDDDDDDVDESLSKGTMELAKLQTKGETRYMVQKLGGGTTCDLTGKERKIEVQFHCNPSSGDRIGMIKEVATCAYLMVIYTPRLCNDVAFMPPQKDKPNMITCRVIYPDDTEFPQLSHQDPLSQHDADQDADAASEEDSLSSETSPVGPRHTIGGIVVGAQVSVGAPGKVIEKSVVVGGGKETLLGTVADSEGNQMSEREMRKLNIRNPADVEKLKRDLKKVAGHKGWRLELVETPRGREYRGIIDGDGDEDDGKGKGEGEGEGEGMEEAGDAAGDEDEGSEEVYKEEL